MIINNNIYKYTKIKESINKKIIDTNKLVFLKK